MKKNKKIWFSVLWVMLPFMIAWVLLFVLPFDKRFGYNFPSDNCMNQTGLLYDRVFLNDKPIDIAFFGTSHTIDAVSDYAIEDSLQIKGIDMHVMNMGYCRHGRNMPYMLLKDLLKSKKPKYVVLEITEKENWDGHMDFGYIADAGDVFMPHLLFNDNIIEDAFKATLVRFESVKQKILSQYKEPKVSSANYGHHEDNSIIAPSIAKYHRENHLKKYTNASSFTRWFYYKVSFGYIDKFIDLAKEHDVKILFLYLPKYASVNKPEELSFYAERAPVLIIPDSIYQKEHYWKDIDHMNDSGATAVSSWVVNQLVPIIRQQY